MLGFLRGIRRPHSRGASPGPQQEAPPTPAAAATDAEASRAHPSPPAEDSSTEEPQRSRARTRAASARAQRLLSPTPDRFAAPAPPASQPPRQPPRGPPSRASADTASVEAAPPRAASARDGKQSRGARDPRSRSSSSSSATSNRSGAEAGDYFYEPGPAHGTSTKTRARAQAAATPPASVLARAPAGPVKGQPAGPQSPVSGARRQRTSSSITGDGRGAAQRGSQGSLVRRGRQRSGHAVRVEDALAQFPPDGTPAARAAAEAAADEESGGSGRRTGAAVDAAPGFRQGYRSPTQGMRAVGAVIKALTSPFRDRKKGRRTQSASSYENDEAEEERDNSIAAAAAHPTTYYPRDETFLEYLRQTSPAEAGGAARGALSDEEAAAPSWQPEQRSDPRRGFRAPARLRRGSSGASAGRSASHANKSARSRPHTPGARRTGAVTYSASSSSSSSAGSGSTPPATPTPQRSARASRRRISAPFTSSSFLKAAVDANTAFRPSRSRSGSAASSLSSFTTPSDEPLPPPLPPPHHAQLHRTHRRATPRASMSGAPRERHDPHALPQHRLATPIRTSGDVAELDRARRQRRPSRVRPAATAGRRSDASMGSTTTAVAASDVSRMSAAALHLEDATADGPPASRALQTAWASYLQRSGHLSNPELGGASGRSSVVRASSAPLYTQEETERLRGAVAAPVGTAAGDPALAAEAAALAKEALLLRSSLLITYLLVATAGPRGPHIGDGAGTSMRRDDDSDLAAGRPWQHVAARFAGWDTAAERRAASAGAPARPAKGPRAWWPALEARLAAAVQTAASELLDTGDGPASARAARADSPPRLPAPQLLLREATGDAVGGLPSLWYPPLRRGRGHAGGAADADEVGEEDDEEEESSVSGQLGVWLSTGSGGARDGSPHRPAGVAAGRGFWHHAFVVGDDYGVRVFAAAQDYVDFASERLLLAVPYTSLAYLIPNFADAAAAVHDTGNGGSGGGGGGGGGITDVHAAVIATVAPVLRADADSGAGTGNAYAYFGFLHRQPRPAAHAASAATPSRDASSVRLAPSRAADPFADPDRDALHAPLLLRTRSRLAHTEWVHFFAARFNRHLYALLFPTASAAIESQRLQRTHAVDGRERRGRRHSHRRHRSSSRSSSRSSTGRRDRSAHEPYGAALREVAADDSNDGHPRRHRTAAPDEASSTEDAPAHRPAGGPSTRGSSASTQPGDSPETSAMAVAGAGAPPAAQGTATGDAMQETWWETIAALRRSLAQRDQRLRAHESEQATTVRALRQHALRTRELEEENASLQWALAETRDRLAGLTAADTAQRRELDRLRAMADATVLHEPAPPSSLLTPRSRHRLHPSAFQPDTADSSGASLAHDSAPREDAAGAATPSSSPDALRRRLVTLQGRLEALERRHRADVVAWRAERAALTERCAAAAAAEAHGRTDGGEAAAQLRMLAGRVVRDLDDFHDAVQTGAEAYLQAAAGPPRRTGKEVDRPAQSAARPPPLHAVAASETAFASLVLRFQPPHDARLVGHGGGAGGLVDGELTVDEGSARLLFSGPTVNQRGRRWELRHHDTDALLRVQLELLSRAPRDARAASRSPTTPRIVNTPPSSTSPRARAAPSTPPRSPPPTWSVHAHDRVESHHRRLSSDDARAADAAAPAATSPQAARAAALLRRSRPHEDARPHLASMLRTVNAAPRPTRASRLRQAAVEHQISARAAAE